MSVRTSAVPLIRCFGSALNFKAASSLTDCLIGRIWPTPVINDAEIYTYRMVALWPGPEPVSTDGSLAAVDPYQNLEAYRFKICLRKDSVSVVYQNHAISRSESPFAFVPLSA